MDAVHCVLHRTADGRTVEMAVVAALNAVRAQDVHQLGAFGAADHRRIMQKNDRLFARLLGRTNGGFQPAGFAHQHFFVGIGFRVKKPAARAAQAVFAIGLHGIEDNAERTKPVVHQ